MAIFHENRASKNFFSINRYRQIVAEHESKESSVMQDAVWSAWLGEGRSTWLRKFLRDSRN